MYHIAPYTPLLTRSPLISHPWPPTQASHPAIYHPLTNLVHISGTLATHDALVWGSTTSQQQENKHANTPRIKVPVYSQLACVTPYVLVPGPWSDEEVVHHVRQLVVAFTDNNSCNPVCGWAYDV